MRVRAVPEVVLPSHHDRTPPRFLKPGKGAVRVPATRFDVWRMSAAQHGAVTAHAPAPLVAQQLHQLWAIQGQGYHAGLAANAYRRSAISYSADGASEIAVIA